MSKSSSWLKGAFLGGLVGGALVLLLTPYKGKELKARINDYINNVQEEVHQAGVEKRLELETELELLRSGKKVSEVVKEAKDIKEPVKVEQVKSVTKEFKGTEEKKQTSFFFRSRLFRLYDLLAAVFFVGGRGLCFSDCITFFLFGVGHVRPCFFCSIFMLAGLS